VRPDLPSFQAVLVNQLVRPCQAHHVCQSLRAFLENLFDHKDPVVPSLQQDLLGQGVLGDLLNPPCQGHLLGLKVQEIQGRHLVQDFL